MHHLRFSGLWTHPDFMKLWVGQSVSMLGSQITTLALPLTAIFYFHADAATVGVLATVSTAPALLFGLFAGVWADRMPRRPILIVADCARFALLMLVPVLALLGALHLAALYLIAFVVGTCTVCFDVAYQSYLPSLVGREQIMEGNGKLETSRSVAQIVGPTIAGILMQALTSPFAIALDALSFLVSAISLGFIRTKELPIAPRTGSRNVWAEINEGLRAVMDSPVLRATTGAAMASTLFGSTANTVLLLYLTRSLGLSAGLVGVIFTLGSIGVLAGAVLATPLARRFGMGRTIIGSMFVTAIGWTLFPFVGGPTPNVVVLAILAKMLGGLGLVVFNINHLSLRQAVTPDFLLGRVSATARFLIWGALPLAGLCAGTLGATMGLQNTLLFGGLGIFTAFIWLLCSPVRSLQSVVQAATSEK